MENLNLIEEIEDLNDYGSEQLKAKFTAYAKKTFGFIPDNEKDLTGTLKKYSKLHAFNLPDPINEPFIKQELFYLFWIADSRLLTQFEKAFKVIGNNGITESYLSVKKIYSKWVFAKNEEEKKYCAKSFINKAGSGVLKDNPMILMLKGSILSVDPIFYSSVNAIEAFENAEKMAKKILSQEDSVVILFEYITSLFKGIIYLNTADNFTAKKYFEDASKVYPAGMNSKFYLALTECGLNNHQRVFELVKEIIEADRKKLSIAVEQKKFFLLLYLFENFFFYNIFYFSEFTELQSQIEEYFENIKTENQKNISVLNDKLVSLHHLELDNELLSNILPSLEYIDKFLKQQINNDNPLVCLTESMIIRLFVKNIEQIIFLISEKCREVYKQKLDFFSKDVERARALIRDLEETLASNKQKLTGNYNSSLEKLEKNYNMVIASTEEKLENLHNSKKYNPKSSFNNAMVYNIIITIFVFIIGGFSGCYSSSYNILADVQSLSTVVLITGFKWANITFLAGFIIALISAGMVLVERSGERQRLLQKISGLKNRKEKEKKTLKVQLERGLKSSEKNYKDRIKNCEDNLNSLIREKEEKERAIEEELKKEIASNTSELQKLISDL